MGTGTRVAKRLIVCAFATGAYSLILVSSVMSFNSQFIFSAKRKMTKIDVVHLIYSSYLLVFLVFAIPVISVLYINMVLCCPH